MPLWKILFINDLITYEANTVQALQKSFEETVDGYLTNCKESGKLPNKIYSGSFTIRTAQEPHKKAVVAARSLHVSLNDFIIKSIEKNLRKG